MHLAAVEGPEGWSRTRQEREEPRNMLLMSLPPGLRSLSHRNRRLSSDPDVDYNHIHSLLTKFFIVTVR